MQTPTSSNYLTTLDALVTAIEQQTTVLPSPARDLAQQLLTNVEAAIQSVSGSPQFANLPVLTMDGSTLVANVTSQAQFAAEHLFRTTVLSQLFSGLAPFAGILSGAMHQAGLWDQTWLKAYESASGHSLSPTDQPLQHAPASQTEALGMDL